MTRSSILSIKNNSNERGELNPHAIGWSRNPYHDCSIPKRWLRKKRWNHWFISSLDVIIKRSDQYGLVGTRLHQVIGYYDGSLRLEDGNIFEIRQQLGICEEQYARW